MANPDSSKWWSAMINHRHTGGPPRKVAWLGPLLLAGVFGLILFASNDEKPLRNDWRATPKIAAEGELAPGNTVRASLVDLKLPQECDIGSFEWKVSHGGWLGDGYSVQGESFQITPMMAGTRLELTMRPYGMCPGMFFAYEASWEIQVNTEDTIRNLTPPRLEGDLRAGGTAQIVPGTWHPSAADVVYVWGDRLHSENENEALALNAAMAGYSMFLNISEDPPALTFAEDQTNTIAVWAVVSYRNYQPLAYLIEEVSFDS